MIRRLMIAAGFGAGYVLGAKAGTQRYEQIMAKAREFAGKPAVQDMKTQVTATVAEVADKAKDTVNDTVQAVSDKVDSAKSSDVVDLSTTARPAATGSGPTPTPRVATPAASPTGTLPPTSPTPPTPPRPATTPTTTPSTAGSATPAAARPAPTTGTTPPAGAPRRPNS